MKISREDFWRIYKENYGLTTYVAEAVSLFIKAPYSPQAVYSRVKKLSPEKLKTVLEKPIDEAEMVLFSLLKSADENVRLKAAEKILKAKGKSRGYTDRQEITGVDGKDLIPSVDYSKMTKDEIREYLRSRAKTD